MRLGRETGYRLRATATEDAFGNPIRQWGSAARLAVGGCSHQPVVGDEETVGRDTVVTRWRLFAPSGTDLLASDRWEHDSVVYEVDGDVQRWTGATHGYVTTLLKVA